MNKKILIMPIVFLSTYWLLIKLFLPVPQENIDNAKYFSQMNNSYVPDTFSDNSITLESFGVKGDGTDETVNILKAINFSKENNKAIKLLGKTYVFSPKLTVDITGIPAITGAGTFDVSATGPAVNNKRMKAVFDVTGKKQLLQSGISGVVAEKNELKLNPNLKLKKGDILFLTSAEPLENSIRPYYCKGQRLIVKDYNNKSGLLTLTNPFFYNINSAWLWLHLKRPSFSVGENVQFITSPMNFITCFRIFYANATISGYYKNFALTAIMYKSSDGVVENMRADLPVNMNNGYSHCIEIADMSDVIVKNCKLSGGRHVVSGTAGGLWEKAESGGQGHAGYPSELIVDGGIYKGTEHVNDIASDIGTLDAHGVVQKMTIRNCTIYGGINLGANYMLIENVIIFPLTKHAFNVGSDVKPGSLWGHYQIKNVTIKTDNDYPTPIFYSKSDIEIVHVTYLDIKRFSENALLMDFRYNSPKKVYLSNINVEGLKNNKILIKSLKRAIFQIKNSDFNETSIQMR